MDWETAVSSGIAARLRKDGAQWELGDLAAKVNAQYGEQTLAQYSNAIGVSAASLHRYRDVSRSFESAKRFADLSWSHHLIVSGRPDREDWLQRAREARWSVAQMRSAIEGSDWQRGLEDVAKRRLADDRDQGVVRVNVSHLPARTMNVSVSAVEEKPHVSAVDAAVRSQISALRHLVGTSSLADLEPATAARVWRDQTVMEGDSIATLGRIQTILAWLQDLAAEWDVLDRSPVQR